MKQRSGFVSNSSSSSFILTGVYNEDGINLTLPQLIKLIGLSGEETIMKKVLDYVKIWKDDRLNEFLEKDIDEKIWIERYNENKWDQYESEFWEKYNNKFIEIYSDYILDDLDDELDEIIGDINYCLFNDNNLFGYYHYSSYCGGVSELNLESITKIHKIAKDELMTIGFKEKDIKLYIYGVSPGGDY